MKNIQVWRIATEAPTFKADSLCGTGAKDSGGRWNRKGTPVLYSSSNIALACLETLVHLGASDLPLNRYLICIDIPETVWKRRLELNAKQVPVGWDAQPAGMTSLDLGDEWLKSAEHPILVVPSAIVAEESNVLINPRHKLSRNIKSKALRKWHYDSRLSH